MKGTGTDVFGAGMLKDNDKEVSFADDELFKA